MAKTAAERQRDSRARKRDIVTPEGVTSVTAEVGQEQAGQPSGTHPLDQLAIDTDDMSASLKHYQAYPEKYIPRREPDKLNWGPWMNSQQLEQAGLKANRVSIPGDWDYAGVAV